MKWPLVVVFVGCMIACGTLYYASPEGNEPTGPRMGYAVGIYASFAAALLTLLVYKMLGGK